LHRGVGSFFRAYRMTSRSFRSAFDCEKWAMALNYQDKQ
jgi:hypothetical protein